MTPKRPTVTLLMAQTLDGRIGRDSDHFPDWTGKEDKKLFVELTKRAGVLVMGRRTYDTIGRPLPGRLNVIMTRDETKCCRTKDLWVTNLSPQEIVTELAKEGYEEVILAGGMMINTLWHKAKLIDRAVLTLSPLVFGDGLGLLNEGVSMHLALTGVETRGDDLVVLRYDIQR